MKCCVPFCTNNTKKASTAEGKSVTFYGFPSDKKLRNLWLQALFPRTARLPDSAVVCSEHFLNDEMYVTKSGSRQIRCDAIPSTVQFCMICLNTERELHLIRKLKLEDAYEKLTGFPIYSKRNLMRAICVQCIPKLRDFSLMREMTKDLSIRSINSGING